MDGYLLINKPTGISSFGVVAKVRKQLTDLKRQQHIKRGYCTDGQKPVADFKCKCKVKVGHTGTLDPSAEGLMILVIDKYTKRAAEFSKLDKTYQVEVTLGATSTTGDREGEIWETGAGRRESGGVPTGREVKQVIKEFVGEIEQIPPIYSAIKVGGQRAYKLARAGKEVKIEPRKITIYSISNIEYEWPLLKFTTEVSSGTYIRTLVEDIGKKLGTGAYMSALRRTKIGKYELKRAVQSLDGNFNILDKK